jgi:hypothetical protein
MGARGRCGSARSPCLCVGFPPRASDKVAVGFIIVVESVLAWHRASLIGRMTSSSHDPVAQLDRASHYECEGQRFESAPGRQ